jgi:hypothetical protein
MMCFGFKARSLRNFAKSGSNAVGTIGTIGTGKKKFTLLVLFLVEIELNYLTNLKRRC